MNRIEEVKKTKIRRGLILPRKVGISVKPLKEESYQLFPQPLDDKELREELEKKFGAAMVTIGISVEDAKTGQMWAFDAERLSKIALALLQPKIEFLLGQLKFADRNYLEIKNDFDERIEEAKREERERITEWGEEICNNPKHRWAEHLKRTCSECWQALKGGE